MIVVVTGGTGFLGSRLTSRLREQGHRVRVVSRSQGCDITRPESLRDVFEGAEVVFHLAALVQSRPGPFEQTNRDGFRNVLEASLRAHSKRLIYVSSFTVFGPSGESIHTEETLPERKAFFHDYDRSKFAAWKLARIWRERIPLNIVFPTVIYGPGPLTEGNLLARLFIRWFTLSLAALPGRGKPRWNFVYVDDVVDGLTAVVHSAPDRDFILGGENISLTELAELLRSISKRRFPILGLPDWLFRLSCHGEELLSRLLRFKPLVVPETGAFLLQNWQFSSSKASSELAYSPGSLEEGLRKTYQWLRTTQDI